MEKNIALALGGGGIKGISHIGILRRLEQHGFQIRAISGTSIGALIGAFYALGYRLDEIEKLFVEFKQTKIYGQMRGQAPSFLGLGGLTKRLNELIGDCTFADLKIPFAITAVWVEYGRVVTLREGSLADALLASMALPGVFPMRTINRMGLIDGGMLNAVPAEAARALVEGRYPVVAVSLTSPLGVPATMERIYLPKFVPRWLAEAIKRNRFVQAMDVFFLSQDMMMRALTKFHLDKEAPDLIIRPAVAHLNTLQPAAAHDLIERGKEAVEASLPQLLNLFEKES
ncbi:MAG: patatin-like phospholipase family protein [Anaerolineales bacterium]|nr:patatin-like phospholipase family protein [Anaerolineales bacterium]